MEKINCKLMVLGLVVALSAGVVRAQSWRRGKASPSTLEGNLAAGLTINLNAQLLKLLLEFRKEAQNFEGQAPERSELDTYLERKKKEASIPMHYLAMADLQGNILGSSPLYTVPEEWGIGNFPELAKKAASLHEGYMHYVPALLDRQATLAYLFPMQQPPPPGQAVNPEVPPKIMLVLLDCQRSFGALFEKRMLLPWESIRLYGPDGDILYQQGQLSINVLKPDAGSALFLSKPADLPGPRILQEANGAYEGHSFMLDPFKAIEHRVYWHESVFIGGDRWVVTDVVEKPLNQNAVPEGEVTGLWMSEQGPSARLVAVQTGSSWRMLLSLNGQVSLAEGRVLNGSLVSYKVAGVNVKTRMQNLRGRFHADSGRLELSWLQDSTQAVVGKSMVFYPYRGDRLLPAPDPHRIRFRVFQ